MRDFIIWWDDVEWEIREVGLDNYLNLKGEYIGLFANCIAKDKKLVYIHNISLIDDDIRVASNLDIFKEECRFFINGKSFLEPFAEDENNFFIGNFIDALEYLKSIV